MKSKLAMLMYVLFAILSLFYGVQMFKIGDNLRGILFMVAVACWVMCIYNSTQTNKRQNNRNIPNQSISKSKKNKKA